MPLKYYLGKGQIMRFYRYPKLLFVLPIFFLMWMESYIPSRVYCAFYCYLGILCVSFIVSLFVIHKLVNREHILSLEKSSLKILISWIDKYFGSHARKLSIVEYQNEFEDVVNVVVRHLIDYLDDKMRDESISEEMKAVLKETLFNFVNKIFSLKKQRVLCKLIMILTAHYRNYLLCLKRVSRKHGILKDFQVAQTFSTDIQRTFKYSHEATRSICIEHAFLVNCSKVLLVHSLPQDLVKCEVVCDIIYNLVGRCLFGEVFGTAANPKVINAAVINWLDESLVRDKPPESLKSDLHLILREDMKVKKVVHFEALKVEPGSTNNRVSSLNACDGCSTESKPPLCSEPHCKTETPLDKGIKKDISPEYEDVEDFASAIEKLRLLLDEKSYKDDESKVAFQVSKSSPGSFDSGKTSKSQYTLGDRSESDSRLWLSSGATSSYEESDSVSIFSNIIVMETERSYEESSTDLCYTIKYDAIFLDESQSSDLLLPADSNVTGPLLSPINHPSISNDVFSFLSGFVQQSMIVKRKLSEFENLQSCLERNEHYIKFLQGIRLPSKCTAIADGFVDILLKVKLQFYLQKLSTISDIALSNHYQEFMGYGHDPNVSFAARSSDSTSVSRFDKLLVKKMSGVFNSLRTALPRFDIGEETIALPLQVAGMKYQADDRKSRFESSNLYEQYRVDIQYYFKEEKKSQLEIMMEDYLAQFHVTCDSAFEVKEDVSLWQHESLHTYELKSRLQKQLLLREDSQDSSSDTKEYHYEDEIDGIDNQIPLFTCLIHLVNELVKHRKMAIFQDPVVCTTKVLLGNIVEYWLQKVLDYLVNKENLLHVCQSLVINTEHSYTYLSDVTIADVQKLVFQKLPPLLVTVLGYDNVADVVNILIGIFQHPQLNRDLMFQFMQGFVEEMSVSESGE